MNNTPKFNHTGLSNLSLILMGLSHPFHSHQNLYSHSIPIFVTGKYHHLLTALTCELPRINKNRFLFDQEKCTATSYLDTNNISNYTEPTFFFF
jgi:hypothetical protein